MLMEHLFEVPSDTAGELHLTGFKARGKRLVDVMRDIRTVPCLTTVLQPPTCRYESWTLPRWLMPSGLWGKNARVQGCVWLTELDIDLYSTSLHFHA